MFHTIRKVKALEDLIVEVEFIDGTVKLYDVKTIMSKCKVFELLKDIELFRQVQVDQGGYGIIWSEEIDLGCNEIWEHGVEKGL